jgi:hypothetical protein
MVIEGNRRCPFQQGAPILLIDTKRAEYASRLLKVFATLVWSKPVGSAIALTL